jgi:hypothetical protein
MYPSILSFETINKLKLFFECCIPRPQDVGHLCFRRFLTLKSDPAGTGSNLEVSTDVGYTAIVLTHFIILIAVLENVPS